MSKKFAVMLHGRTDNLHITADSVESTNTVIKFFSSKDGVNSIIAEFPQHSVIGYYDTEKGKFSYE